jgi:hypothetical protein
MERDFMSISSYAKSFVAVGYWFIHDKRAAEPDQCLPHQARQPLGHWPEEPEVGNPQRSVRSDRWVSGDPSMAGPGLGSYFGLLAVFAGLDEQGTRRRIR